METEVMTVTDNDLERLVREAHDEDAAVADLEGCLQRLQRARQAKTTLAHLPADQLRTVLQLRRRDLGGDPA
jgi:hypothetical protein